MNDIPPRYNPQDVEKKWYNFWQENQLFCAQRDAKKKAYTIVIPPPNITGILHMGHALNNTYQDILIRFMKMQGLVTLWMPGTDHAGIATQNVVEREIAKAGLKRGDLGREKFLERVWAWQKQYGGTIIKQLKSLGASCDWPRTRFTMDDAYSKAVKDAFIRLWQKKLIYQDIKVINWCPRCQTALSDEEAPHHELSGNLYYLKYPFKDNPDEFLIVATTRPETMLGDTAVAVNPKDKRYQKLIGKTLILPLMHRPIDIIADDLVDKNFGTGAVKVTPAHDPNDYILGKKHNLEFVNIMNPDGKINKLGGKYNGMDRFEAREVILEDLREKGLLAKIEPHKIAAGHCYRCHTIIEPYLSQQWFVKMKPLAKPAIEAVKKGKIKFHPARWEKVYLNWMENIHDWCISRQIWWGHRIPLWYCQDCNKVTAAIDTPAQCKGCASGNLKQDEDVLDTWFSSWLWPFATFGWPEKDKKIKQELKYFYPTDCLVTAPEIIFFWVARMIMAGIEFMGDIPFRDVYIHGTVRDIKGRKMSKSLGNIIDPLEIINDYGADALRFSLISITASGQDVFLSKEKFQMGRNFTNKIWNASRFILMNLKAKGGLAISKKTLNLGERWILSRLEQLIGTVKNSLGEYDFNESAKALYEFFWHEFCDWFIELSKQDMAAGRRETEAVLVYCMREFLKVLHPFMPFISEEIYSKLPDSQGSICLQSFPELRKEFLDVKLEGDMAIFTSLVSRVRNLRAELDLEQSQLIDCIISADSDKNLKFLESLKNEFKQFTKTSSVSFSKKAKRPAKAVADVEAGFTIYLPLSGDTSRQLKRIQKKINSLSLSIEKSKGQLKNKDFLRLAPREIVNNQKEKLEFNENNLKKLEAIRRALKD